MVLSCGTKDNFTSDKTTQFFLVDYNPAYLDVLWVVDSRSPLFATRDHLLSESKRFFQRLDGMTTNYQMAFIKSDMLVSKGKLQPESNPIILKRNFGSIDERTNLFGATMSQYFVNMRTDADSKGFQAAQTSLSSNFVPRTNVPLVLVFISDADDHSDLASGQSDAVAAYSAQFLALKGGNANLVRPYSINYVKLDGTEDAAARKKKRCATEYTADIDTTRTDNYFQDRYFKLATQMGGDTADLCSNFSEKIDLTGLKIKTLPNRFMLDRKTSTDKMIVDVFTGSTHYNDLKWTYSESTNELVFDVTPPEGATIQVTYR